MLNLLPREDKFYKMLKDLESYANVSARLLKKLADNRHDPEAIQQASEGIYKAKRESKKAMEVITQEICRTLITPFDREDIQQFATVLYNIPKMIAKITDRMLTHNIHPFNNDFNKFADIIEREAD